jgi:uncharacterized membrane protein YbhN (UPF0104 family)
LSKAQDAGRPRYLSLAARIIVAVVAVGWVLHGQDWAELGRVFRRLSLWYFALGLAAFAASQLIIAFRWCLRGQAIHVRQALLSSAFLTVSTITHAEPWEV